MKLKTAIASAALLLGLSATGAATAENQIAPGLEAVDVIHEGKIVTITRSDVEGATLPKGYDKVSRHCPPFCVQPMQVLPGVETIGELEMLGYLKRMSDGDASILVVDSRDPDWVARGTIPGAVHVPWRSINTDVGGAFAVEAEADTLDEVLAEKFGAKKTADGAWDFADAKTLVLFCNGLWCGQSSINIRTLAKLGYPLEKMKWYRGGMQDWVSVGLTTVTP
jgi:rhodanese-related sulfurtransferase